MNRQKIYLAIVLALIFMSSCGSSAKIAKNCDEMKSDSRIWDYLDVSDRERTLVDSIVALDEYAVFLDSYKKYRTKKNAMREGEDVEQTKEFAEYVAACSKILRITDELKLSVNASVAVFEKMREVANNK
ncbi:hypothetical protein FNW54_01815 [Bacteroides sp. HF-5092]|uniref:hypothetical protein n=1 Tax=Bacteroides TaxID=816 RepID=UPI001177C01F|nr:MULTISPECIES: hypothetical protein [Bacteroides]TRX47655.1 hypothetical protein FNW54_01815 [Bacteroides sp. HF-5092]